MNSSYSLTRKACYAGYITQAAVNNLSPLLFTIFRKSFGLSVAQLGFLVAFNFAAQMVVDLISAGVVDKIGTRVSIVSAHFFAAAGLVCMGTLPFIMDNGYAALLIAATLSAIGGGLTEVLISPIIESLPSDNKAGGMSLLHSFYCWGHAGVVVLSTIYFSVFGIENWRWLAMLWAMLPFVNAFVFIKCPLLPLVEEGSAAKLSELAKMKIFWLFLLLMLCAGASEQAVSQWTSYFAQTGLKISKTAGDLMGTLMFALLMGTSRAINGTLTKRFPLKKIIAFSSALCAASYMIIVFAPFPALALAGCGICGFSVGVMWPGTFSLSAEKCPNGGTAMFAFLALAGDIGCSSGPALVGEVSQLANDDLKKGIFAAAVFPIIMLAGTLLTGKEHSKTE